MNLILVTLTILKPFLTAFSNNDNLENLSESRLELLVGAGVEVRGRVHAWHAQGSGVKPQD